MLLKVPSWASSSRKTVSRDSPLPAADRDSRLAPRELIVGVELGGESKAYPFAQLAAYGQLHPALPEQAVCFDSNGDTLIGILHGSSNPTGDIGLLIVVGGTLATCFIKFSMKNR